jgi:hypothetical protein
MKKPLELFFFFRIKDPKVFKAAMLRYIIPRITSTAQLISPPSSQPDALLNVAFTASGLATLGVFDNLNDHVYTQGQYSDAYNLGDPGYKNWVKGFVGNDTTHGVFLIARFGTHNLYKEGPAHLGFVAISKIILTTFSLLSLGGLGQPSQKRIAFREPHAQVLRRDMSVRML